MLPGFGSYEVKYKPARRGRNPQTGSSITLRERKGVKFKPSQLLRKAINGQLEEGETMTEEEEMAD